VAVFLLESMHEQQRKRIGNAGIPAGQSRAQ
jgi:hypothetical protein